MRILSMHILYKRPDKTIFLKSCYKLDFVAWLKVRFVKATLNFGARTTISRINKGQIVRIESEEHKDIIFYGYINDQSIGVVISADKEYPESAACKVILEILTEFMNKFTTDVFKTFSEDQDLKYPEIEQKIVKYQDPTQADKLIKIENDLSEIQTALHKTMEDLFDRGEKLDDLVKQSEDISGTAYSFYKKSKEANQTCCSLY